MSILPLKTMLEEGRVLQTLRDVSSQKQPKKVQTCIIYIHNHLFVGEKKYIPLNIRKNFVRLEDRYMTRTNATGKPPLFCPTFLKTTPVLILPNRPKKSLQLLLMGFTVYPHKPIATEILSCIICNIYVGAEVIQVITRNVVQK